jgi:putative transposase
MRVESKRILSYVDLILEVLPFGRLWYGEPNAASNAVAFDAFKTAAGKLQHWRVLAAVLMPDHLHAFAEPTGDRSAKPGNFSGALKRWMRQELKPPWNWQLGSFDRLLRFDESLHEKWLYVRENPVRAGLVEHWKDWPYQIGFDDV